MFSCFNVSSSGHLKKERRQSQWCRYLLIVVFTLRHHHSHQYELIITMLVGAQKNSNKFEDPPFSSRSWKWLQPLETCRSPSSASMTSGFDERSIDSIFDTPLKYHHHHHRRHHCNHHCCSSSLPWSVPSLAWSSSFKIITMIILCLIIIIASMFAYWHYCSVPELIIDVIRSCDYHCGHQFINIVIIFIVIIIIIILIIRSMEATYNEVTREVSVSH